MCVCERERTHVANAVNDGVFMAHTCVCVCARALLERKEQKSHNLLVE